jgi:hypothetical protein
MYIIGWYWDEGYDFINSSGEHIKGETRKALVLDCDANGAVVRSRIVKVAKACPQLPLGQRVDEVYYDAYGKLLGVREE